MPTILHNTHGHFAIQATAIDIIIAITRKVNIRKVNKVVDVVIGILIVAFASLFIHVQYMYM